MLYFLTVKKVKCSVTVIRRRQTANRKSATCAAIFVLFRRKSFLTGGNGRERSDQ